MVSEILSRSRLLKPQVLFPLGTWELRVNKARARLACSWTGALRCISCMGTIVQLCASIGCSENENNMSTPELFCGLEENCIHWLTSDKLYYFTVFYACSRTLLVTDIKREGENRLHLFSWDGMLNSPGWHQTWSWGWLSVLEPPAFTPWKVDISDVYHGTQF